MIDKSGELKLTEDVMALSKAMEAFPRDVGMTAALHFIEWYRMTQDEVEYLRRIFRYKSSSGQKDFKRGPSTEGNYEDCDTLIEKVEAANEDRAIRQAIRYSTSLGARGSYQGGG